MKTKAKSKPAKPKTAIKSSTPKSAASRTSVIKCDNCHKTLAYCHCSLLEMAFPDQPWTDEAKKAKSIKKAPAVPDPFANAESRRNILMEAASFLRWEASQYKPKTAKKIRYLAEQVGSDRMGPPVINLPPTNGLSDY